MSTVRGGPQTSQESINKGGVSYSSSSPLFVAVSSLSQAQNPATDPFSILEGIATFSANCSLIEVQEMSSLELIPAWSGTAPTGNPTVRCYGRVPVPNPFQGFNDAATPGLRVWPQDLVPADWHSSPMEVSSRIGRGGFNPRGFWIPLPVSGTVSTFTASLSLTATMVQTGVGDILISFGTPARFSLLGCTHVLPVVSIVTTPHADTRGHVLLGRLLNVGDS